MNKREEGIKNALRKIALDVYLDKQNLSQITISFVNDTVKDLDVYTPRQNEVNETDLDKWKYKIELLLEVFNPEMKYDIEILKTLDRILSDWRMEIESKKSG